MNRRSFINFFLGAGPANNDQRYRDAVVRYLLGKADRIDKIIAEYRRGGIISEVLVLALQEETREMRQEEHQVPLWFEKGGRIFYTKHPEVSGE